MDICGICGSSEADDENARCNDCGGDYWVQPEDFDTPDCVEWIIAACDRLNKTRAELKALVCED